MKKLITAAAFLVLFACTDDPNAGGISHDLSPSEHTGEFAIAVDDALGEMYELMGTLYGAGTRAARREVARVETLRRSSIETPPPNQVSGLGRGARIYRKLR